MPSVHYKFKSSLDYKTLMFEGIQISVGELKKLIYENEKIGKSADFDLQITNAQTKQVYEDESSAVQRNASVIVARVPTAIHQKLPKVWDTRTEGKVNRTPTVFQSSKPAHSLFQGNDLATQSNLSEDEKLKLMQHEATQDYDPSQYVKGRQIIRGTAPSTLRCNKCGQVGDHWIKDCPLLNVRRPTGIPKDELMETTPDDPQAMLAPGGRYVVAIMDKHAHLIGKKERPPFYDEEAPVVEPEPKKDIPSELTCSLCNDLLREAVVIPCCGYSFCDECIRNRLLESGHECPRAECREKVSPDLLVPNSQLRKAITNFRNETGYMYAKRQAADSNSNASTTSSRLKINLVTAGIARANAAEQKLRSGSIGPDVTSSPNQQPALGNTQSPDNRGRDSPAGTSSLTIGTSSSLTTASHNNHPRFPPMGKSTPPPSGIPSLRIVPSVPPPIWPPVSAPPSVMTAPPIHSIHHLASMHPQGFLPNMLPPQAAIQAATGPPLIRYHPQPNMPITGPPGVPPSMGPASSFPPPGNNFMPSQPPPPGVPSMPTMTAPVVTSAYVVTTRAPPFLAPRRPLTEAEFYDAKRRMHDRLRGDRHRSPRPQDAWEEFLARKDRKRRRSSSRSSRSSSRSRSRSSGRSRRSRSRSVTRSRSRTRSPSYHTRRRRRRERSRSGYSRSRGRSKSRTPSHSRRYNRRPRRASRSRSRNRTKNSPNSRAAKWSPPRHSTVSSRQPASAEISQSSKSDQRPTVPSSVGYATAPPAPPPRGQSPPAQTTVTTETTPAAVSKDENRKDEKVDKPVKEEKQRKTKEEKPSKEKRVKNEKSTRDKDSKSEKEETAPKASSKKDKTPEASEEPKEVKEEVAPIVQETPIEPAKEPSVPKEEPTPENKNEEQGEKRKKAKKEKKKKRKHHHKSPRKKSDEEPESKPKKDKEKEKEKSSSSKEGKSKSEKRESTSEEKSDKKEKKRESTSEEKGDKKEKKHRSHKKDKRKSESGSAAQTEVPSKKKRRD